MHHFGHLHSLGNDHAHQVLGRSDDDDTIHRQALEHGQRYIAGSGRHIHEQVVHILPDHIGPELLDSAGNDGATPDHRRSGIIQQQIDGHHLDTAAAQRGVQAILGCALAFGHAEGSGCGGAGNISIQHANPLALPGHSYSQHGGDGGLTDAALAGNNGNDILYGCMGIQLCQQTFRLAVAAGGAAAAGAVTITRTHSKIRSFDL